MNDELFDRYDALTFDDVVIVPGYSETLPDAVDTSATFAADIELAVPLVSAAMDKVTEARLAIAMARNGGIGVIHRNMSIQDQAAEVQKVKRSQSGMITDPVTLTADATLHDAEAVMHRFKFSGVPIIDAERRLIGILTNRDIRFCEGSDFDRPVTEFMTAEPLVTAAVGTSLDEAKAILQRHRIEKLPLVEADGRLAGLITVKDIQKRLDFPNASRDSRGRLRCAAAVGVGEDVEARVEALVAMSVDAVSIDTAHGHSANVVKAIERIKGSWPDLPVTAGNVVTEDGVETLARAGADAVKVGVGAGSICTTRVVSGAGMPQLSAIYFAAKRARELGVPIIADGGITFSGDIVKAIAAGAETVMLGSLLAGTEESPGEMELFEGRRYKSYRGMGSTRRDDRQLRRPLRHRAGFGRAERRDPGRRYRGRRRQPQAGARGDRGACAVRRTARRRDLPARRRPAVRDGVRRRRDPRSAAPRTHDAGHCSGPAGVASPRRHDHQGSPELPALLTDGPSFSAELAALSDAPAEQNRGRRRSLRRASRRSLRAGAGCGTRTRRRCGCRTR